MRFEKTHHGFRVAVFQDFGARNFWAMLPDGVVGAKDECWEWTDGCDGDGYGVVGAGGKTVRAHRVAWEVAHGPIPDGVHVLHQCDNPPCINPAHLFLGTQADNMADKVAKGRPPGQEAQHERHERQDD